MARIININELRQDFKFNTGTTAIVEYSSGREIHDYNYRQEYIDFLEERCLTVYDNIDELNAKLIHNGIDLT